MHENFFDLANQCLTNSEYSKSSMRERADWLLRISQKIENHFEMFVQLERGDTGKCEDSTRDEVRAAIEIWRDAAALARTTKTEYFSSLGNGSWGYTQIDPIGIVGLILPWNFPLIVASERLPFMLAAGCAVLIKPSEYAKGSLSLLAEICREELPDPGIVQLVGDSMKDGEDLVLSGRVNLVSFTGSTRTGYLILKAAATNLTPVKLELGGKNSVVVESSRDLTHAAISILSSSFANGGQACIQGSRIIIKSTVYDEFIHELPIALESYASLHLKKCNHDFQQPQNYLQRQKIENFKRLAKKEGLDYITTTNPTSGPRIYLDVPMTSKLFSEEIFGGLITVTKYETDTELMNLISEGKYGLAMYIWSENEQFIRQTIRDSRAGRIWVNGAENRAFGMMPVGGSGDSGYGREMGSHAIWDYSNIKTVIRGK